MNKWQTFWKRWKGYNWNSDWMTSGFGSARRLGITSRYVLMYYLQSMIFLCGRAYGSVSFGEEQEQERQTWPAKRAVKGRWTRDWREQRCFLIWGLQHTVIKNVFAKKNRSLLLYSVQFNCIMNKKGGSLLFVVVHVKKSVRLSLEKHTFMHVQLWEISLQKKCMPATQTHSYLHKKALLLL